MTMTSTSSSAAREEVLCAHCHLPVPTGLIETDAEHQFCCHGCKTVFSIIHACHLDRYYAFRDRDLADAGQAAEPAKVTGKSYREFDDPTFLDLHASLLTNSEFGIQNSELRRTAFFLEGTHCAACVWLVEKLPNLLPGVSEARLDLGKSLLTVTWRQEAVALSRIGRMLDSLGYPPHPARSNTARSVRKLDDRRQMIRIGVAGACAGNTMLLAVALYAGMLSTMDPAYRLFFRWLSTAIGIVALAWPGSVFFRGAWAAIKTRTPHLDLPIALALGAGGIAGVYNTITNTGDIYFDSLSVLVFLLLVGRFLQHRQQTLADDSVELLFSLTPMTARRVMGIKNSELRIENDERIVSGAAPVARKRKLEEVPITALKVADVVEVLAGESVPVDGVVLEGSSSLDESLLTGESRARGISAGDVVHAGTVNLTSAVLVAVRATGEETRVGRLMRLVTQAARSKAPIVLLADRLAGWFLVVVLAIAAVVFFGWFLAGSKYAAEYTVAILIVACPCALGLATPLAVSVAIGRAARRGILIKGGETLERLAKPGLLLLDKTGTLTTGRISVVNWVGDESIKPLVLAIERHSTHPTARAMAEGLTNGEWRIENRANGDVQVADVVQCAEGGITGTVDGRAVVMGSRRFVRSRGMEIPGWADEEIGKQLAAGASPVVVAVEGAVRAVAACGDGLRPDAAVTLAELRTLGWRVEILSGDDPAIVQHVAGQLGIPAGDAKGGLLPEQKLVIVQSELQNGPVVMVGDGVNDAAALAAATVGIAVHGGAEASLSAASIYLNRPGLRAIVDCLRASRRTLAVIHRAMAASLAYNTFGVTLAALGLINPLVAAILMPISSLTVLSLAFGAKTFKNRE